MIDRQGVSIERLTADLGGIRGKFLRLRWQDPAQAAQIMAVTLHSISRSETPPKAQWSAAIAPSSCGQDSCDYTLPADTPVDSLRIVLAETNTLASLRIIAHRDLSSPPARAHRALMHRADPPCDLARTHA